VLPTVNQERLDILYGSHTDGSVLQANMATGDVISTATMVTGVGAGVKSIGKGIAKELGKGLDKTKPDFYVRPNGDVIPSTGYRAVSGPGAEAAKQGDLMSKSGDTYFTFDNPAGKSAEQIQSELQIPNTPTHYGEFDTLQIIDDTKIPYGEWGQASHLEPIVKDFPLDHPNPKLRFGKGGATQAITNTPIKDFKLKEIKK